MGLYKKLKHLAEAENDRHAKTLIEAIDAHEEEEEVRTETCPECKGTLWMIDKDDDGTAVVYKLACSSCDYIGFTT